jgi:hypothetical protein
MTPPDTKRFVWSRPQHQHLRVSQRQGSRRLRQLHGNVRFFGMQRNSCEIAACGYRGEEVAGLVATPSGPTRSGHGSQFGPDENSPSCFTVSGEHIPLMRKLIFQHLFCLLLSKRAHTVDISGRAYLQICPLARTIAFAQFLCVSKTLSDCISLLWARALWSKVSIERSRGARRLNSSSRDCQ